MKIRIVPLFLACSLTSYGQFNPQNISLPIPEFYELAGISGRNERFEADSRTASILWGRQEKSLTIVQKAESSYDNKQYIIFDNYDFDDSNTVIKHEAIVRTVFVAGERELRWRWTKAVRLANENILVAVRIEGLYGEYLNRFLLFDKSGTKLTLKQDYYLPGIADIIAKEQGEFLIVAEKNFVPIYLPNYSVLEHDRIGQYQDMFRNAYPSTSLLHFSNVGKLQSQNDYNVHTDPKIAGDVYMDFLEYRGNYYLLTKSYLVGTVNVPTLVVIKISKDNPKLFSNRVIQKANIYNSKSYLYVLGIKVFVKLTNGYVEEIEIAED